ncbi:nicotinate-nucleotide--dimethylbenzimidazole phosphoribosyltransferase [Neobacillus cucumis]|uniref:nicotinate-nucleotide--dimethylbenzimidazole phosphoribosyltransferase n=1 Tax=Neobacillus cucumis TaxID=1740721 RepID=UPI002853258C|nr:nicotinate-nucleotide--dimethylbenzimidazole phosphoribosyltransferase [Neobacillus cucumis]MDR4946082.1 nicotinate-nucleotide--dimethylbenzimidazole phosphoribosyltransferase [Neobacillus cucumis]
MPEIIYNRAAAIRLLNSKAMQRAEFRLDDLTKPKGSLGILEQVIIRLAGITGNIIPSIDNAGCVIFASDHGVNEEGVSAYDSHVTEEMTVNMCMGGAVSSVLARHSRIDLQVVDVGIKSRVRHPKAVVRKISPGTRNFVQDYAMSREQAVECVSIGLEIADQLIDEGKELLIFGEMGIGNTTSAAAMAAVLLDLPVRQVVGKGTGISDSQHQHKIQVIETALTKHCICKDDPWDILAAVGGFEIGAMAGAMIAAASRSIPVVLDGFMTGIAALLASRFNKDIKNYLFASHCSLEQAHIYVLKELQLEPMVQWQLRLGEGSGALLILPTLQQACRIMAETSTFEDAKVSNPHRTELKEDALMVYDGKDTLGPSKLDFSPAEQKAVYKALAARRDIRSYLPDPISKEALGRIIQAAHLAPSVGFMQPWNFIVISDQNILNELYRVVEKERIRASVNYTDMKQDHYLRLKLEGLLQAPMTICVTNHSGRGGPHVLGRNTIPETDLMSTACAIENMWLAARVEGIAMGWISIYQKEDIRKILGIPDSIDPVALLTIGYTSHFPDIPVLERVGWGKRSNLKELIFQNIWGKEEKDV